MRGRWYAMLCLLVLTTAGCSAKVRPDPPGPVAWTAHATVPFSQGGPDLSVSPLSLDELLGVALKSNPGLDADEHRWEAARARPEQVSSLPDPVVSLTHYVEEVVTRNGPIDRSVMFSQKVPFLPKLLTRASIAEKEALMVWQRYMGKGLELVAKLKKAYFELWWVNEAIRISDENKELLQRLINVAQTKHAAGEVTQQDVLKAQVEHATLSEELNILRELKTTLQARVNKMIDRVPESPLGDPAAVPVKPLDQKLETLYEAALERRPELLEAEVAIERAELTGDLAGLESFPDFSVGFGYSDVGDIELMGAPDPGRDAWTVTFGLTLPLWQGKRAAQRREARALLSASYLAKRNLENETRYLVKECHYKLEAAHRLIGLYRDSVLPQAQQALEVSETAYAAVPPRVDFLTVIDNQRRLLQFRLALARSTADFHERLADLERVVGTALAELE